jgi:hypothetical protein
MTLNKEIVFVTLRAKKIKKIADTGERMITI